MDEVYIRTQDMARWVAEKYFDNRDFVTLEDFYRAFEQLSDDYDRLQEDFDAVTCIPDGDEHEDYY